MAMDLVVFGSRISVKIKPSDRERRVSRTMLANTARFWSPLHTTSVSLWCTMLPFLQSCKLSLPSRIWVNMLCTSTHSFSYVCYISSPSRPLPFIVVIILSEGYKLRSSLLCNFLQPPVTSFQTTSASVLFTLCAVRQFLQSGFCSLVVVLLLR
jgi:hypothetical protein